jgi:hypothetical protein
MHDQKKKQTDMTEVFKTNVLYNEDALMIKRQIIHDFPGYAVNFDLEDCDHVLRVRSLSTVDALSVIDIVRQKGFRAEVLPDEVPALVNVH